MNKTITFLFLLVIVACNSNNKKTDSFELTSQEALALISTGEDLIAPDQAISLQQKSPDKYQFIDLRPESEFVIAHMDGAINIPTQYLLDPEHTQVWTNTEVTKILYGNNQLQVNGPWLLLRQIGYDQIKVMQGGYDYIRQPADSTAGPLAYVAERAHYDYPAVFKLAVEDSEEALKAKKPTPVKQSVPKAVVPKKKKAKEDDGGGC